MAEMREEIDSCEYLFLRELHEPADNMLRVVVEEAKPDDSPEDSLDASSYRAIEPDMRCRLFELVWSSYVAYSVRNESFCVLDETEAWEGRLFCRYSKSHFLDYVSRSTINLEELSGPLQHWGINCLNHIVDVVSTEPPLWKSLRPR